MSRSDPVPVEDLEPIVPGREAGPSAPSEPAAAAPRRIPRRAWLAAVLAVLVVAGGLALTRDGPASAAARLDAVRQFLDGARSVRFEASHEVGEQFAGATYRTEGQLRFPGWARRVSNSGSAYDEETIHTDQGRYERLARRGQRLAEQKWTFSAPAVASRWAGVGPDGKPDFGALLAGLGPPLDGEPDRRDLRGVVRALRAPERMDEDTIRATLPLTALFTDPRLSAAMLDGTGAVEVKLTVGPGGRLDRMGWSLDARRPGDQGRRCNIPFDSYGHPECVKERADIRFLDWNGTLEVFVPDIADVDITPGIDEEELAALPSGIALAPAHVPGGLLLERAEVISESAAGGGYCEYLVLGYGRGPAPGSGPFPILSLRVSTGPCPPPEEEFGPAGRVLMAGRHRGALFREPVVVPGAAVFPVGTARVTVEWSDVAEQLVLDAVASLAPLDLATQPVYRSIPPQY